MYTSFAGSILVHKMGDGEGDTYLRERRLLYFKFCPVGGVLIRRGAYSGGRGAGTKSKIYSNFAQKQVGKRTIFWTRPNLTMISFS